MTPAEFRVIRDGLGLPIPWVARALGVSPRTVARWEAGQSHIGRDVADSIRDWSTRTEVQVDCATQLAGPGDELLTYASDADYRAAHPTGRPPFTAAWHRLATYRIAAATGLPVTFIRTPASANRDWTTKCE